MTWMATASLTSKNCSGWCEMHFIYVPVSGLYICNCTRYHLPRSASQGAVGAAIYRANADMDGDGEIDRQELAQYLDVVASQQQTRVIGRTNKRVKGGALRS